MAAEAKSGGKHQVSPDDGTTEKASVRLGSRLLHCPECGGQWIKEHSRPFLLNGAICFGLLILALLLAWLNVCAVALIVLLGLVASLYALPVTLCITLVSDYRCRSCGHRFISARGKETDIATRHFPWGWFVLSFILLLLLCITVPLIIRVQTGAAGLGTEWAVISAVIKCGLFLWGVVIYQAAAYLTLRRRLMSQLVWAILLVWPSLVIGGRSVYLALPAVRADALLAKIGTAPLPSSARDVKIATEWCPDQEDVYIRFAADPNHVARFLEVSPILKGAEPEQYVHRPVRAREASLPYSLEESAAYRAQEEGPEWFRQRLMVPLRRFLVRPEGPNLRIEVSVDERRGTVYVHLRHVDEPSPSKKSEHP